MLDNLVYLNKECIDDMGKFKARDDEAVRKLFGAETLTPIDIRLCLYAYFLITETSLYNEEACESYVSLYIDIMESGGHAYYPELLPYMNDIILYIVLKKELQLNKYIKLLDNWEAYQEKNTISAGLELPHLDGKAKQMSFLEWEDIVNKGHEPGGADDEKATRRSVNYILEQLGHILAKDIENCTDIEEIFDLKILKSVANTEIRRKWYLIKMLYVVVKRQIKNILELLKKYQRTYVQDAYIYERLRQALGECWLERKKDENQALGECCLECKEDENSGSLSDYSWKEIGSRKRLLKNCKIEEVERALYGSFIDMGKIARAYDAAFDGSGFAMFCHGLENEEKRKENGLRDHELENRATDQINHVILNAEQMGAAFAPYEVRSHMYSDPEYWYEDEKINEQVREIVKRASSYFGLRALLYEKRKVSREMLLLTVLLSIANDVDIQREYITDHILFNGRFPEMKLTDEQGKENQHCTVFDEYFIELFKNLKNEKSLDSKKRTLRAKCGELEQEYLFESMYTIDDLKNEAGSPDDGIAIFHEILLGKRVM